MHARSPHVLRLLSATPCGQQVLISEQCCPPSIKVALLQISDAAEAGIGGAALIRPKARRSRLRACLAPQYFADRS